MKLNLLPSSLGPGKSILPAIFLSIVMLVASTVASIIMIRTSAQALKDETDRANGLRPQVDKLATVSAKADEIALRAVPIVRNINLFNAMQKASDVYPAAYDSVLPYIPPFYRIFTLNVAPSGGNMVVNMSGVIKGYQQYNDLLLALLRIPGATGITRSGMGIRTKITPGISVIDQEGRTKFPDEGVIPDDPEGQVNRAISQGGVTGFVNAGGFGTAGNGPRGAMPLATLINVQFTVPRNIATIPNPRATIAEAGPGTLQPVAAPAAGSGGKGASTGGGNPGG
ncbi:MAG: hypothetical protein JSS72_05255 [Armatimonadetes bacterium]|nr:hypothetical protein [Armatimonadota bacterium]